MPSPLRPDEHSDVTPHDLFDLLSITAGEIDGDKTKFASELVDGLRNYHTANAKRIGPKPKGYYEMLKMVCSSHPAEIMSLIAACRGADFDAFSALVRAMDYEALRRLNIEEIPKNKPDADLPAYLREDGKRSAFEILAGSGTQARQVNAPRKGHREADQP